MEPSILYKDGEYWLWYTGISKKLKTQIGLAKSKDGINFEKTGSVMKTDIEKGEKIIGLTEGDVIWNGEEFEMFYAILQKGGQVLGPIWHAVSTEGVNWEKTQAIIDIGQEGTWTSTGIHSPNVLVENGKYKMWYAGTYTDGKSFFEVGIGYATAKKE